MDIGTGGIPTTDNIPEPTEIFGSQTDNITDNLLSYMRNWISSGMGMGTGGIPTTDNIPETN